MLSLPSVARICWNGNGPHLLLITHYSNMVAPTPPTVTQQVEITAATITAVAITWSDLPTDI